MNYLCECVCHSVQMCLVDSTATRLAIGKKEQKRCRETEWTHVPSILSLFLFFSSIYSCRFVCRLTLSMRNLLLSSTCSITDGFSFSCPLHVLFLSSTHSSLPRFGQLACLPSLRLSFVLLFQLRLFSRLTAKIIIIYPCSASQVVVKKKEKRK